MKSTVLTCLKNKPIDLPDAAKDTLCATISHIFLVQLRVTDPKQTWYQLFDHMPWLLFGKHY